MPKCKKCGADIYFVTTKTGKLMPIDTFPPANKTPVTIECADGSTTGGVPHWATCPNADEFRK